MKHGKNESVIRQCDENGLCRSLNLDSSRSNFSTCEIWESVQTKWLDGTESVSVDLSSLNRSGATLSESTFTFETSRRSDLSSSGRWTSVWSRSCLRAFTGSKGSP